MSDTSEFICLIEFTNELLRGIVSSTSPLTLPDPAPANLDRFLSADEKGQCSSPEGLKCGSQNVCESDDKPAEMILRVEDNKWALSTNWRRMLFMGILEPDTFMSLWAYKDAEGVVIFDFQEDQDPRMDTMEDEMNDGPSEHE